MIGGRKLKQNRGGTTDASSEKWSISRATGGKLDSGAKQRGKEKGGEKDVSRTAGTWEQVE